MFCIFKLDWVTNQYSKNTMGRKRANSKELKSKDLLSSLNGYIYVILKS